MNEMKEKVLHPKNGFLMLFIGIVMIIGGIALAVYASSIESLPLLFPAVVLIIVAPFIFAGLKVVNPNEALVLTFFGKYHGTIKQSGFFFVNPFVQAVCPKVGAVRVETPAKEAEADVGALLHAVGVGRKTVSIKTQTLNNDKQKVNDVLGNPIVIGAAVIWRVENPTLAVFSVENYREFLSIQTDTVIRNTARLYPYDVFDEDENDDGICEKTLRGSALEIAENMKQELQERVKSAGIVVEDVRITHLAYAEEIAAAMLQRQQAAAIIAARQKIVDGAVGMVKMAIDKLSEDQIVALDEERKAAMVSNLLVVLCGNKDAQPIVNSGSIY
ncbi:MAG: SPFH domain-containing protein [Clostridia bacterium]|nr:SPFH domain-containing protein [Clostridia bacterium]